MKSIHEVVGQELVWVQPARLRRDFELRAGDEVVANLQWQRSSLATAQTAERSWTFKREGFWHPRITVRVAGSDDNVALFSPGWTGGGTLELGQARTVRFGAANFWHSEWQWEESTGEPLIHFKSHQGLLKHEGQVEVEPSAAASPDLPLLVVLGWYLLVLFAEDAATSAASTSVIVSGT